MIPLREDTSITTVGNYMKALEDIYHDYFPESYLECFIRNEPEDLESWLVIGLHLSNDEHASWGTQDIFDSNRFCVFLTATDHGRRLGYITEDSLMSPEVWLDLSDYEYHSFGSVMGYNDDGEINTELVAPAIKQGEFNRYTPEEVLDWFRDFCKRLYKTAHKMVRKGQLKSEWGEYL